MATTARAQNREAIQERRARVEELYLMSYTQEAIGNALHVSRQTVTEDIRIIRERNAKRYETLVDPKGRMRSLYAEIENKLRKIEREAWSMYYACKSDNYGLKNSILQTLRNTVDSLAKPMEIVAPSLNEKYTQEQMERLRVVQEKLDKEMQEFAAKGLIAPIPGLKRPDWIENMEKASSQG